MARKPLFNDEEAAAYLRVAKEEGRIKSIPKTPKQQQRLARGLSKGKSVSGARGHGVSESRPAQRKMSAARSFTYKNPTAGLRGRGAGVEAKEKVSWHMGPTPKNADPALVTGRIPQPDDLIRLVEKKTTGGNRGLINVGVYGWLQVYMDPLNPWDSWLDPHTLVDREWLLNTLRAMPLDHTYTANDPLYLQLAHDIFQVEDTGNQTWQWTYVFQWSVRDI